MLVTPVRVLSQNASPATPSITWTPTSDDRDRCGLPETLRVQRIADIGNETIGVTNSVYMGKLRSQRFVFAASVRNEHGSEFQCVWFVEAEKYIKSTPIRWSNGSHALRIDLEGGTGLVRVAALIALVQDKPRAVFSFRPSETCPTAAAPCWNYSRKIALSDIRKPNPDVTVKTRSWCTAKDGMKCYPEKGPQVINTVELYTFVVDHYQVH